VTGTGEVRLPPDEAVAEFSVEVLAPTADEARSTAARVAGRVLASVSANGVEDDRVETLALTLHPRWTSRRARDGTYEQVLEGYEMTNAFRVSLDTAEAGAIGHVVDDALREGGEHVRLQHVGFRLSEERRRAAAREVRARARAGGGGAPRGCPGAGPEPPAPPRTGPLAGAGEGGGGRARPRRAVRRAARGVGGAGRVGERGRGGAPGLGLGGGGRGGARGGHDGGGGHGRGRGEAVRGRGARHVPGADDPRQRERRLRVVPVGGARGPRACRTRRAPAAPSRRGVGLGRSRRGHVTAALR